MLSAPPRWCLRHLASPCVSDSRLRGALEHRLATAQSERRLPSAVAPVFRDGAVLWERALGLADVACGDEATVAHRYRIGSITKTFTTVAVLQFRDAGGTVSKLYVATYPATRAPSTFGEA